MRVLYVSLALIKKITSLTQYTILLFFFARAKQGFFCGLFRIASALLHAPSAIETHAGGVIERSFYVQYCFLLPAFLLLCCYKALFLNYE